MQSEMAAFFVFADIYKMVVSKMEITTQHGAIERKTQKTKQHSIRSMLLSPNDFLSCLQIIRITPLAFVVDETIWEHWAIMGWLRHRRSL